MNTIVPTRLWKEICDLFVALVAQCKDCVRGNPVRCWYSNCAAFPYRDLARRIVAVKYNMVSLAHWMVVENEILATLKTIGRPVSPSALRLDSTRSKAVKHAAINRLVRKRCIVETRTGDHSRLISLPQNVNPKGKKQ